MPTPQALAILESQLKSHALNPGDEEILEYAKKHILYNDSHSSHVLLKVNHAAPLAILCGMALVYAGWIIGRVRKDKSAGEPGV